MHCVARCAEPGGVDLRGGNVAEHVLVEGGQLGELDAQVQAAGDRVEHDHPAYPGAGDQQLDALADDGLAQIAELGDDLDASAVIAMHVDAAHHPVRRDARPLEVGGQPVGGLASADERDAHAAGSSAPGPRRRRSARRGCRQRRARAANPSSSPSSRSVLQTTADVTIALAATSSGWTTRTTGRWGGWAPPGVRDHLPHKERAGRTPRPPRRPTPRRRHVPSLRRWPARRGPRARHQGPPCTRLGDVGAQIEDHRAPARRISRSAFPRPPGCVQCGNRGRSA